MIRELEFLRGFAAFYVFFGHLLQKFTLNNNKVVDFVFCSFGQEMVMIFFLLSGFVIALSWDKNKISKIHFLKKRFFRIYPLMILSLLLSFIYVIISGKSLDLDVLLGNIFNLQDFDKGKPKIFFKTYYNSALWSLSYEWWFYVVFILIVNKKNRDSISKWIIIISSITYLFFPNQISRWLMYFGVWWCGFLIFNLYTQQKLSVFKNLSSLMIFILLPLLVTFSNLFIYPNRGLGLFPALEFRHMFFSLIIIVLGFLIFNKKYLNLYIFNRFRIFERIAPFSYGLYILHLPITYIIIWITPVTVKNEIVFVLAFVLSIVFSYFAEIKFQKGLTKFLKSKKII